MQMHVFSLEEEEKREKRMNKQTTKNDPPAINIC